MLMGELLDPKTIIYKSSLTNNNMPKKDSDGSYNQSESGNWNVADDFSKVKIMTPLAKCELYEDIATFGYENFIDELINFNVPNEVARIKALERLVKELIRVCKNADFAMKKQGTKDKLKKHEKNLKLLMKLIPVVYAKRTNQANHTSHIIINEKNFEDLFGKILDIKSEINEPLNKNHLIFVDKEQFDPKAFKEQLKDRMINQG